jgi:hypothetical protein
MGITIQQEAGNVSVMTITGMLKKSELSAVQNAAAKQLTPSSTVKLLLILKDFQGWDKQSNWDDISFYAEHGDQITRIAIVADPKWETDWMMFLGAGIRKAPVKFFAFNQLNAARAWLAV